MTEQEFWCYCVVASLSRPLPTGELAAQYSPAYQAICEADFLVQNFRKRQPANKKKKKY